MREGLFVVVDGPDGSGKSKIISELKIKLENAKYDILVTKETTMGPIGTLIKSNEFKGAILAELVAADRLYHLENDILPALSSGKIVVSDRYVASSYVCQQLDGVSLDFIKNINSLIIPPDLSVFVSADISIISERLSERPYLERMERISTSKMVELYKEAVNLFKENKYGYILELQNNNEVDLKNNIEKIYENIITCLGDKLWFDWALQENLVKICPNI